MVQRKDPYLQFNFRVEIDGVEIGGFSDVSGLQAEVETEDFHEGGQNAFVHKFAKHAKFPNLTLKRGIFNKTELTDWVIQSMNGDIEKKSLAVVLNDNDGTRGGNWRFEFSEAYPVKWSGSDLSAKGNDVFVENVEFVHHGMKMVLN